MPFQAKTPRRGLWLMLVAMGLLSLGPLVWAEDSTEPSGRVRADSVEDLPAASLPAGSASDVAVQAASRPTAHGEYKVARVLVATIDGSINPGSKEHFVKTIEEAEARGFGMVVFELDTPGGLLDSTRDIVKAFMSATIPVAVLVAPAGARAASAGAFITMAAHVAAMAPGTNIGAAHPVTAGGGDVGEGKKKSHMAEKVEQDTAAFIEGIARQRHRNVDWARKAVVKSVSIVSSQALKLGVIDLLARDLDELLQGADGLVVEVDGEWKTLRCKGARVARREMSLGDSIVNLFADPNVSYLLFMAGMLGIAMELYHPGAIFPGVLGALSLLLAFISFQIVPINVGGVLLILVGGGMLVAEAFVPSFGALGIGGAAGIVIGGMILVDDVNPNLWADASYGVSPWMLWPTVVAVLGLMAVVGTMIMRSRREAPVTGQSGMIGQIATVVTAVSDRGGQVRLGPEIWAAISSVSIAKGQRVRVIAIEGLRLTVEALGAAPDEHGDKDDAEGPELGS